MVAFNPPRLDNLQPARHPAAAGFLVPERTERDPAGSLSRRGRRTGPRARSATWRSRGDGRPSRTSIRALPGAMSSRGVPDRNLGPSRRRDGPQRRSGRDVPGSASGTVSGPLSQRMCSGIDAVPGGTLEEPADDELGRVDRHGTRVLGDEACRRRSRPGRRNPRRTVASCGQTLDRPDAPVKRSWTFEGRATRNVGRSCRFCPRSTGRQILKAPVRYSPDVETVRPDAAQTIAGLCETFDRILQRVFDDTGRAVRAVHANAHGILEGVPRIGDGLAPDVG